MILLIILDGAEEYFGGESIFNRADMPVLKNIRQNGINQKTDFCPPGQSAESLACILTMLGVKAENIPYSRAPIEALAADINLSENDRVMRCNLVSHKNGILTSFNASGLLKSEMKAVSQRAESIMPHGAKLFHLSEYRNLLLIKDRGLLDVDVPPPHESVGKKLDEILNGLEPALKQLTDDSKTLKSGYMLYPWGAGQASPLPSFYEIWGKSCGCVCKAEIMLGICKAMNINTASPQSATADYDTDISAKLEAAIKLSAENEVVIIHINGTDELSHRKNLTAKINFLEKIDKILISGLIKEAKKDFRIIVTSDHITECDTGKHKNGEVNLFSTDYNYSKNIFSNDGLIGYRYLKELMS